MQELIDDEQRSRASFTTSTRHRRGKCGWCIDSTIGMKSTKRRKTTLLVLVMLLILGGIIGIVVWLTTGNSSGEESIESNKNKEFESKDNPQVEILDTGGGGNGTDVNEGSGMKNETNNKYNEEGKGTDFDGLDLTFTFTTDMPSLAPSSIGNTTNEGGEPTSQEGSNMPTISTAPTPTVMGIAIMDNDDDDIFGTWSDDTSLSASQELNGTDVSLPTSTSVNNSTNSSNVQQLPEDDPLSYLNVTSLDDDMLSDINVVSFNDTTTSDEDKDSSSLSPTMSSSPSSVGIPSLPTNSSIGPTSDMSYSPTISNRPTTSLSIYPPPPSSTDLITESKLQITIPGNLTLSNLNTPTTINEQELLIDVLERTIMDVMNQDVLSDEEEEEEVIVKDVVILRINGVDVVNDANNDATDVGLEISGDSPPRVPSSELSMPSDPLPDDGVESDACILCPNGITAGNDYIPTDFGDDATCKEIVDLTAFSFTKDDESCKGSKVMEVYCCPTVQENPCLICGLNGLSIDKEDEMPFIDDGDMMTCKELVDFYMALDANSEICLETLTETDDNPCCPTSPGSSTSSSPPRVPSDDPMMPSRIPNVRQLRGSTRGGEEVKEVKVITNFLSRELQSVLQAIDNSTTTSNSTNTSTIVTIDNNTTLEVEFNLLLEETCTNITSCEDELNTTTIYYQTNVTESMVESVDDGSFTTILQENVQSTVSSQDGMDNSTTVDMNTTNADINTTESTNSSSVTSAVILFEDVQVVNGEFGTDNSVRVTVTEEVVTTPTVVSFNDTIVDVNETSLMPTASPGPSSMLTFNGTNNATDDEDNSTMIPTSSPGPTSPTISPAPTNLVGSSSNDPLSYPPSSNSTLNSLDDDDTTDIICPMDVQLCPDGSYVSRVPQDMCNFAPCDGMGGMNDTIVDVNNSTTNSTLIYDDGNSTTNGTTISLLDIMPTVSPAPTPTQDPLSSSFIPTSDSLFNSSSVSPSSDLLSSSMMPTSSPGPTSNLTSLGTENGTVFDDDSSLNETIGKTISIKLQANETLLGTSIDEENMLLFEPYSPSPINATSCYEQCLGGDEYDGCDTEVVCGGTLPLDLANATTLSFQWDASIDGTKYISIKGSTEPTKIEFMTYIDDCTAPYQEIHGNNITYEFNTGDIFEWQKFTYNPEASFVTIGTCDGCGDKCEVFTHMVFMPDDNYNELDLNFNSLTFSVTYDPQLVVEGNEYEWYTNGYTWIRKPEGGSIELVDKEVEEEVEDESQSDSLSNETAPSLVIVGNNQEPEDAFPLNECEGNCQSDADCAQDLKCFFTNEGVDTVTGCSGQIEAGRNYCYLPGHIFLIIAGENQEPESAYPLRQCEGNCQSDEDCAQGLVCFMRDEFEDVIGCYGDGEQGANYCIAANETTLVNNETVIESISLDDLSSPYVMSLSMEGDEELGRYGSSVSISSDVTVVAVSAKDAKNEDGVDTGAVYLYSMSKEGEDNTTSLTLLQVLYGESSKDEFGSTVALSQDGSRLVVGSRGENDQMGAARIYELEEGEEEASSWTLMEGGAIIGAYPSGRTGFAVSVSHDGNVVAIGSPTEGGGVIRTYKYTDPNAGWIEYGAAIEGLPSREAAGYSISLSDTGSTMAIGFPKAKNSDGSVNAGKTAVYMMTGDEWVVFGQEIYGEADNDIDGGSVAMSQDGTILVIGGKGHDKVDITTGEVIMSSVGYCRIYEMTQLSSEWEFQYSIKGTSADERLGTWVALSSDGNTVACGGVNGVNEVDGSTSGVVRLYNRLTEQESTIWPRGEDVFDGSTFGASLALDNDGKHIIVGAPTKSRIEDNSPHGIIQVFETTVQEMDEGLIIEDGDNVTSIQEFNEETNEIGTQTMTEYAPGTITIAEDDKDVMTAVISDDEDYMPVANPNPNVIEYAPGPVVEEDTNMTVAANPNPGVIEYPDPGSVVEEDTNMTTEEIVADDSSNTTSIEIDEFNEADDGNGTVTSIEYAPGTVVVAEEGEDVMTVALVAVDEDEVMTADDIVVLPIVEDEEVMVEGGEEEGPLIFPEAPDNMEMGMEDMVMAKNSLDAFANDRRLRAAPQEALQHNP